MAEVYATPDHVSPEPHEVSVDTLSQKVSAGKAVRAGEKERCESNVSPAFLVRSARSKAWRWPP